MSSVEEPKSPEAGAESSTECCGGAMRDWCATAEKCAREEPLKVTGIAFLAGLLCTILPVGAILGMLVRLVLSLMRPALLVLGVMKVVEEIDKRRE
jgi:hypothetical protein